jgi:transcriptional regulator with XRE-family HTH domain
MSAILSMDLKRAMATNVRRERHARKLTQEELADRAGLSARYLGSIERATVSASVTVLGRVAQALRIDPCELIRLRARGKRLGNPKLSQARRHAEAAKKEIADRYSANILPVIREIQGSGVKSLRGVARALAARGVPTARGGAWTPVQVTAILQRAK